MASHKQTDRQDGRERSGGEGGERGRREREGRTEKGTEGEGGTEREGKEGRRGEEGWVWRGEGEGVRRWAAGEGDVTGRKEIAFTETKDIPSAGAASSAQLSSQSNQLVPGT